MRVTVRLPRPLLDEVRADLVRPHRFAAERVGFLYGRLSDAGDGRRLVLLTGYTALDDARYINDPEAGARIDSQAIRGAMQGILDRGEGVFHVHLHEHRGTPRFSRMDRDELPRLIPSFQAVGPHLAHGLFVLSEDQCAADIWLPGSTKLIEVARIGVVGFPLQLIEWGNDEERTVLASVVSR
jgi:hypothetical protein